MKQLYVKFLLILAVVLLGVGTASAQTCHGADPGTDVVVGLNVGSWNTPVLPSGSPWTNPWPFTTGGTGGINCTVCPATFSAPMCANQFALIWVCPGNVYTFSFCDSPTPINVVMTIGTSTIYTEPSPGYFGSISDDDGCGITNGPSWVTFSPSIAQQMRILMTEDAPGNPCTLNASICGQLTIDVVCNPPPPVNDLPCNATVLPVSTECNFQTGTTTWSTGESVNNPGCGTYINDDVWFTATVPPSGNLAINTGLISASSLGIAVYQPNSCADAFNAVNWQQVACAAPGAPTLELGGLNPLLPAYIRVWHNSNIGNMGTFQICAYEPIPPLNNLPCGANALPVEGTCNPNMFDTENATPTALAGLTVGAPTCGLVAPLNDVWFTMVVPPSGQMTVTTFAGTLSDMAMAWYRLSVGGSVCTPPGYAGSLTQIAGACNDDQSVTNLMPRINSQVPTAIALVPGETIYVRVWAKGANQEGTFEICARENLPPPNDDPCGAIPIATSLTCNLVPSTNENSTLTTGVPNPSCGTPVQNDVWYTVIIPAGGEVQISTQGVTGELTDAAMAVYTATGSCPSSLSLTQIPGACAVGGSTFGALMPALTVSGVVGTVLYVRVWRQAGLSGGFNICARQTVTAATLPGCDVSTFDSGGPSGNYSNNENSVLTFCPENTGDVVALAFSFFSTQQGFDVLTIYNGSSTSAPVVGQYSGSQLPPGFVSTSATGCITIQFTSNGSVTGPGYAYQTSCGPPIPPQAPQYGICNSMFYDSGGPGGTYQNNEFLTWTFCSPVPGEVVTITFLEFNVEQGWDFLTVFDGSTTAAPQLGIFTGTTNPGTFTGTSASGCLTVRFTTDFSVVASGWAATVRCGPPQPPPPPPPPPTGVCGTTVYDPGGPNGNYPNAVNQTPGNVGGNGCFSGCGLTWWQTYCPEVPGDVVTLTFLSFAIEFGWDNVYIYNGPVVSPYNANGTQFLGPGNVTCGGPAGWCNNTLGPGGFTGTALPGSFTATISPTNPNGCITISMTSDDIVTMAGWSALVSCQSTFNPGSDCIYVLRMYDSYGDGWTGSNIAVSINGNLPNYYTVQTGYYFEVPLSVDNGDVVSISYNGLGLFASDNYWTLDLLGASYSQFHSAVPAVNNQNYTFTVTCMEPPPAPEDCMGSETLCSSAGPPAQNAIPGATNFGSVGDLYGSNWGCLAGTERYGTWSVFGCLTSGDIGFTLVPNTANENLDWAIWGPFPAGSSLESICVPSTAPIRCSTASYGNSQPIGTGQTGTGSLTYSLPQYAPAGTVSSQGVGGNGWLPGVQGAIAGEVYLMYVSNGVTAGGASVNWTGTAAMDCEILPVELFSFNATAGETHVDVDWSTASEMNSSHFDVQRSADGRLFSNIGTVPAAGNSMGLMEYRFVDGSPMEGLSYYRLMMVDQDGSAEPSHAVPVLFRRKAGSLELYPNPAAQEIYVMYTAPEEGGVNWRMFDASGRLVMTGNRGMEKGLNRMEIDVQRLDMGSYMIELRGAGDVPLGMARFVKQ